MADTIYIHASLNPNKSLGNAAEMEHPEAILNFWFVLNTDNIHLPLIDVP
jgi:hypothetical protein